MKRSRYVRNKNHTPWYLHDIIGILFILTAFFILCALLSYNPYDPTWFYATTDPYSIKNWCGVIGAHLAALLMYTCAGSSIYGVFGLFFLAYECVVTKSYTRNSDRIIACYILMCTSAAWCFAYQVDCLGASFAGGIVGMYIYQTLYKIFDSLGALLCIYTVFLICLLLITRLSLVRCIQYARRTIQHGIRKVVRAQPKIEAFFRSTRTLFYKAAHSQAIWMTALRMRLGVKKEEIAHEYTAYFNEGFDETMYDSKTWDFDEPVMTKNAAAPAGATFCDSRQLLSKKNLNDEFHENNTSEHQNYTSIPYTVPDAHMFIKKTMKKRTKNICVN